ncbi:MAG TPA: hypothetical protein VFI46_00560 [Jiangellaceae bacterium]|nr:hypothetical protein [Jiangellaceae bacterium]
MSTRAGSTSGGTGQPTPTQQRRTELDAKAKEIFEHSGGNPGTYGSPRVHA